MANRTKSAAIGMFGNLQQARYAVDDLRRNGFLEDEIGFVTRGAGDMGGSPWSIPVRERAVSPIGLITAGGVLTHSVSEVGGTFGGLVGDLTGLGVPLWEAEQYEAEFIAGMTLVLVDAGDRRRDAITLLRRYGAVGVQTPQESDVWN